MSGRVGADDGMTLVELIVSISVLAIIIVPIVSSFLIGTLEQNSTRARVADSASAELVSLYLPKDIEGSVRVVDPTGGVIPTSGLCAAPGTVKLQLEYNSDGKATGVVDAASVYVQETDSANQPILERVDCLGGNVVSKRLVVEQLSPETNGIRNFTVLCGDATQIKDATPNAATACTSDHPAAVRVQIVAQSVQVQHGTSYTPFTFNVQATRRSADS